ncbi:MAG: putative porin [Crocinitomicaceae bacterium]|jgi:predicted porin
MKSLVFLIALLFAGSAYSQHEFQSWTNVGLEGGIIKKLDWSFELNARVGGSGLETFFPQAGLSYKVTKWFKPSIEYRYIFEKDEYENYSAVHRINFNAGFKERVKRFDLGLRLRYQYAFDRIAASENFNPDFDQAIRAKVTIEYDIDNSILAPFFNAEFFYNPQFGPKGPGFSKMRYAIGTSLELDGPHDVSIKYQLDKRINDYSANVRHVVAVSYTYEISGKKKEKKSK